MRPDSISIVVPVYNGAATLPELIERLATVLPGLCGEFEAILVNDGSRDESWKVIQELASEHAWVHGIELSRNFGQHNALLAGIRRARGTVTVTMDDDLQHPPEEIAKLLDALTDDLDVVYGSAPKMAHSFLRNLASGFTKLALKTAMGIETARNVSAFRVFRTPLKQAFDGYAGSFISIDVLLTWATSRFGSIEVRHDPRKVGTTNYTFFKLLTHASNMLTGYSTVPLQIASWVGFCFTLFGMLVLAYVVGRYLIQGTDVAGFPFLASIIALFSGAQLFAIGVIGEYLARMHFRLMGRPTYVVRATSEDGAEAPGEDAQP